MFEVTEIISLSEFDFKASRVIASNNESVVSITTQVNELVFGNIKITLDSDEESLVIEELNENDKRISPEMFRNKTLTVNDSKTRPGDPAGTRTPPKVIIRPRR